MVGAAVKGAPDSGCRCADSATVAPQTGLLWAVHVWSVGSTCYVGSFCVFNQYSSCHFVVLGGRGGVGIVCRFAAGLLAGVSTQFIQCGEYCSAVKVSTCNQLPPIYVWRCISRVFVAAVFAYPGGASMEIHQALTRSETVDNILCRHEQVRSSSCVGPQGIASSECCLQTQQAGSAVWPVQARAIVPSMRREA
jgi:hypothetical protein